MTMPTAPPSAEAAIHHHTINSSATGKLMRLRVVTPPGYTSTARYPVVYLLHLWGRNERYWTDNLNVHQRLAEGIARRELPPMLLAMPEGDKSFYVNAADPPGIDWAAHIDESAFFENALRLYGRYGDYLMNEALPFVEHTYPVRTDRAGRAIGGLSMGGAGAAVHAFRDPARFCAVGIHAPAIFLAQSMGPPWIFGLDADSFAQRNPADLAARHLIPATQPRIWLDCGWEDNLRPAVAHLHQTLTEHNIAHDFHLWPGGHNGHYWRAHVTDYLRFYAREWPLD